jgi:predicted anti-sigma-YlaC factor YlaD
VSAHLEPEKFDLDELSVDEQAHVASCEACRATRRDAADRKSVV